MKVFDLSCADGHVFEGWFASEADFVDQLGRGMVCCPVCGDPRVQRRPSAPRLNLGPCGVDTSGPPDHGGVPARQALSPQLEGAADTQPAAQAARQAQWLHAVRELLARTEDVGDRFADQARRMHHGELEERPIRGQTTAEQARALLEEGVPVLPLAIPQALKETLQ